MKTHRPYLLILSVMLCISGFPQNKTSGYLTEAYRFESGNSALFTAYAAQAEKEGAVRVALFFRAIAQSASVHAGNFQKILSQMGITVSPSKPQIVLRTPRENVEEAFHSVRMEAGIKYAEYMEQAKAEGETNALKALRWAKETEQESLELYTNVISALADDKSSTLPSIYWVCPKCGNLYDVAAPEKECSFCYTERGKFIKIQ